MNITKIEIKIINTRFKNFLKLLEFLKRLMKKSNVSFISGQNFLNSLKTEV